MNRPMTTQEAIRRDAMAIVNQILDLADIEVIHRQSINDRCDDIVSKALLDARLDENRKWSEGELSLYGDGLEYTKEEIQSVIRAIADMHISHLKGEKSEVPF